MIRPRKHLQAACGDIFFAFEAYAEATFIKPAKCGIDPSQERGIGAQSAAHHFTIHQGLDIVERVRIILDVNIFPIDNAGEEFVAFRL